MEPNLLFTGGFLEEFFDAKSLTSFLLEFMPTRKISNSIRHPLESFLSAQCPCLVPHRCSIRLLRWIATAGRLNPLASLIAWSDFPRLPNDAKSRCSCSKKSDFRSLCHCALFYSKESKSSTLLIEDSLPWTSNSRHTPSDNVNAIRVNCSTT